MRKYLATTFCLIGLLVSAAHARAEVINFDDLSDGGYGTAIPNGYHGLNWTNFYVMNTAANEALFGPSGYSDGTVSAPNVAFNGGGLEAIVSDNSFTFNSGYFTAAWNNGLTITVDGYLGGNLVDTTSFVVNTTGPTLETFNWTVDTLDFTSSGGTNAGYHGAGTQFALDNLTINEVAPVPEPAAVLLLATLLSIALLPMIRKAKLTLR